MNWPYLLLAPIIVIYLLLMIMLSVYVLNYLYLAFVGIRYRRALRPPPLADPIDWPRVTVQLPIYNELYVASRLLAAAAALDYPRDRLEIQVLDDSTDETVALVAAEVARQRLCGIDIVHLTTALPLGETRSSSNASTERARTLPRVTVPASGTAAIWRM